MIKASQFMTEEEVFKHLNQRYIGLVAEMHPKWATQPLPKMTHEFYAKGWLHCIEFLQELGIVAAHEVGGPKWRSWLRDLI